MNLAGAGPGGKVTQDAAVLQPDSSLQLHVTSRSHHINHMAAEIKPSIRNTYKWRASATEGQGKVVAPWHQRQCRIQKQRGSGITSPPHTHSHPSVIFRLPLHTLTVINGMAERQGQKEDKVSKNGVLCRKWLIFH